MPKEKEEPKLTARSKKARKPWVRPQIRTGKLYETNSLTCGKNDLSTTQCLTSPTNS